MSAAHNTTLYNPFSLGSFVIGPVLGQTKRDCIAATKDYGKNAWFAAAECVLTRLTSFENAIVSTHQYTLTLWPAFIGAICAWGPDPSTIVYDNIWWALIFGLTCSGMPGLTSDRPPHHVDAVSTTQGRAICENWRPNKEMPREISRSLALAGIPPRRHAVLFEWFLFTICALLYVGFCITFAFALSGSFVIFAWSTYWLLPLGWYWLSIVPAVATVVFSEVWQDRIELYESQETNHGDSIEMASRRESHLSDKSSGSITTALLSTSTSSAAVAVPGIQRCASVLDVSYSRVITPSIFGLWLRVLKHQWYRRYYRLLVKPGSKHPYFQLVNITVALIRLTVFAFGSILMGNIILMPIPQDVGLFVLLLVTSAIPRGAFPSLWTHGARGADVVVFVKPVGLVDS